MQRFIQAGGDPADLDSFKVGYARRRREPGHLVRPWNHEVHTPDTVADRPPVTVHELDRDVYRIDRVRTPVGPVGPIVIVIHANQCVNFETLGNLRLLFRMDHRGQNQTQRDHRYLFHAPAPGEGGTILPRPQIFVKTEKC